MQKKIFSFGNFYFLQKETRTGRKVINPDEIIETCFSGRMTHVLAQTNLNLGSAFLKLEFTQFVRHIFPMGVPLRWEISGSDWHFVFREI